MEILVPGLVLVALMVWASTRIKRNAAAAFEAERIETDDLVVDKPEGFLHVLNDDSGLLFRAYSRDFGIGGDRDARQAVIEVERHRGTVLDKAVASVRDASETFEAEPVYLDGGEKAMNAHSVRVRDGGEFETIHKFVTRGPDVVEARAEVLAEHKDSHLRNMEEALEKLLVK